MTCDASEILRLLRSDTPLARARVAFSAASARIEQACQQSKPPSIMKIRQMEFDAVRAIAAALGVPCAGDDATGPDLPMSPPNDS